MILASFLVAAHAFAAPVRVVAVGDLALGPRAKSDPIAPVAALLDGDLRFCNLESPIGGRERGLASDGTPTGRSTVRLAAPSRRAGLLDGRFDVVSLANNHALDQGAKGRAATVRALAKAHVAAALDGETAHLVRGGRAIAVIARALPPDVDLAMMSDKIAAAVADEAARGAIVLVSLHWGHTASRLPTEAQRALAARLVDAGATAILGHGPHSPQGVERRGRAVIAYSLGNLAFDCRCTDETDAYALSFTVDEAGAATGAILHPIEAGLAAAPATPSHDADLAALLADLSRALGSDATVDGSDVRVADPR